MVEDSQRDALIVAAGEAREQAYAPYSHYRVGAAVLAEDGRIFSGANVENASYGLTLCAERSAVAAAVTAGARRLLAAAVCTENGVAPCGACRQVLSEFAGDMPIWLCDAQGQVRRMGLAALLPERFGPEQLPHNLPEAPSEKTF
ncbi:MAG: cytidine deaminase [Chloroflexi bacterium]|nr:cytidine deaminase [Chloroflexota bacterium]MCI0579076.1 cytidine deaminase [Chloroflexota bacterium]MCI0644069.1 cytidine deaminase [Chloroflexota bacterium]MCI0727885.1 cytidine deaminase [Chloroflexota bacterium]